MTAQDQAGRVPGPAEVRGLARVETKAPVEVDRADGPDGAAVAARVVARVRARAAAAVPDVEATNKEPRRSSVDG